LQKTLAEPFGAAYGSRDMIMNVMHKINLQH